MKKLLLPLALLALGLGGGVGAGLALGPPAEEAAAAEGCAALAPDGAEAGHGAALPAAPCDPEAEAGHGEEAQEEAHAEAQPQAAAASGSGHGESPEGSHDYVKLPNQFIVPVVEDGEVAALMLLSLSVEVPGGAKDGIAPIEPKLRDSFLQVLFDHANTGGFGGMFTASGAMRPLRAALLDAAQAASGGLVTDVLIVDMVREDR